MVARRVEMKYPATFGPRFLAVWYMKQSISRSFELEAGQSLPCIYEQIGWRLYRHFCCKVWEWDSHFAGRDVRIRRCCSPLWDIPSLLVVLSFASHIGKSIESFELSIDRGRKEVHVIACRREKAHSIAVYVFYWTVPYSWYLIAEKARLTPFFDASPYNIEKISQV